MPNNISALVPEFWSNAVQIPFVKSLAGLEICNTQISNKLTVGDTFHFGYVSDPAVADYTPGTAVTPTDITATDEYLSVDKKKVISFYVDDIERLQAQPDYVNYLVNRSAYLLRDTIDTDILAEYTNAGTSIDNGDLGGTAGDPITLTTSNVAQLFSVVRQKLDEKDVPDAGDWFAVISPSVAQVLTQAGVGQGFNFADSVVRNGRVGEYMGFSIYVSNNVASDTSAYYCLFGKKGSIDLALQVKPQTEIKDVPDKLGKNFLISTVYGVKTFTKKADGLVSVKIAK